MLYGGEAGPDLEQVAGQCNMDEEQVIELHCTTELEIGIMGFLPGLAYMTGLHPSLHLPRRAEPRTHVRGGSVAIAMDQTVIYPLDSPGGWNLIGLMPIPLFDARRAEPVLLTAGERCVFILSPNRNTAICKRPVKMASCRSHQKRALDNAITRTSCDPPDHS